MRMTRISLLCLLLSMVVISSAISAQTSPRIGLRGGVGTDINLGLAYGGGANYLITTPNNSLELGLLFFGGSFDETTEEGIHTYDESTDIFVFGVMANYLIGYNPDASRSFFIAGIGLASISIDWEERSKTDESLGTLLPGGGSMQAEDGSGGGTVFNLGIGKTFSGNFDLRAEVPVIVSFSAPGSASAVIPTFIVTAGIRF